MANAKTPSVPSRCTRRDAPRRSRCAAGSRSSGTATSRKTDEQGISAQRRACWTGARRSRATSTRPSASSGSAPTASEASRRAPWPGASRGVTTGSSWRRSSPRSVVRSSWPKSKRPRRTTAWSSRSRGNRADPPPHPPTGSRAIERFRLDGTTPVWTYAVADGRLEKRVWMEPGANTTYVQYRVLRARGPVALRLEVLVDYRDYHGTTRGEGWQMDVAPVLHGLRVTAFEG